MRFPNRSNTNRAVQAQKRASLWMHVKKVKICLSISTWKFSYYCTIRIAKSKALIGVFVFEYTDCLFSHDVPSMGGICERLLFDFVNKIFVIDHI